MADNERERAAHSIPITEFISGKDDFDEWVDLFQDAVKLATNAQNEARKHALYLEWLPLKLDDEARAVYRQCEGATWDDRKASMKDLMIDPQEIYKWKAKVGKVAWDGKESFHRLATRVKRAVDKFDKDMNDASKANEYFFRFREALPDNYKTAIDMGCSANERTLERAKELALRLQMTQASTEDKSVSFVGASMSEDRLKTLEFSVKELGNKFDDMKLASDKSKSTKDSYERSYNRDRYERYPRDRRRDQRYSSGSDRSYSRQGSRDSNGSDRRRTWYGSSPDRRSFSRDRGTRYDYGRDRRDRGKQDGGYRSSSGSYSRSRNRYENNGRDGQTYRERRNDQDSRSSRYGRDDREYRNSQDRRDSRQNGRQDSRRDNRQDGRRDSRQDSRQDSRGKGNSDSDKTRETSRDSFRSSQSDVSLDTDTEFEEFRAKKKERERKKKSSSSNNQERKN